MKTDQFRQMKALVGLTSADARHLRELGPCLEGCLPGVVDIFYEQLLRDPQAQHAFSSAGQVQRLRGLLKHWMGGLFSGQYDDSYLLERSRIGEAHVRVNLPQRFMLTGMHIIRTQLTQAIRDLALPDEADKLTALNRILDLDLTLMLETYRESYIASIRAADKRAMQRQIDEVQHMAALGQLAASLAHEIKNPLAGISGAIQIMSQEMNSAHPHFEIMREILRQIDRLDSAVKDLLIYARPKSPDLQERDVGETILNCLTLLNEDPMIKSLVIRTDGLDRGIAAMLDQSQFEQVISNLVLNAAQACNGQGLLRIGLQQGGERILVTVADNGPGMSADVVRQALEPFFTTKARGTGLGLPICKRIIEGHHGHLDIHTAPDQGTTVNISLPELGSLRTPRKPSS